MMGLTLMQPWAWAIAHAGKDVENRTWAPNRKFIGQRIAIHAGRNYDSDAHAFFDALGIDWRRPACRETGIVATATLRGVLGLQGTPASLAHNLAALFGQSPWLFGPLGWCLADVVPLRQAVPCRGSLMMLARDYLRAIGAARIAVRSWCPTCKAFLNGGDHFKGRACGTCHSETVAKESEAARGK